MCGLGNEVSKNILLAGVKHMTLLDHTHLEADEWRSQFLAPQDMIGKNVSDILMLFVQRMFTDFCASYDNSEDKKAKFLCFCHFVWIPKRHDLSVHRCEGSKVWS